MNGRGEIDAARIRFGIGKAMRAHYGIAPHPAAGSTNVDVLYVV